MELKGDSGGGGGRGVGDSTKYMFAAKVMDKKELVSRNKDVGLRLKETYWKYWTTLFCQHSVLH